ncbi:oxidoreductase [Mycetocola tolaasinivorans]|uniref:Oxidoreductase n=1 Tax=Mycetocola tolaasinivorans TaxID=76635 RepID=A0A3L7A7N5_9MICO|nr:Gfo/Idh/MocA family oxidoreductase [Mycetocola tolaasinivorans]RLP75591.1 oxidoreductase [Mycetocola tolaasinivorans]
MSGAPIRVAIIGYGLSGSVFHAPLISANDRLSIHTIVTANPERATRALERYPAARVVASPEDLFADLSEIDLIVLASPTPTHVPLARRALEAGVGVVVDKPFAVRAEEGRELIGIAARTGALLTVFQNRRWDGDFLTVRRLIESGALGEVYRFESRFEWRSRRPRPEWKSGTAGIDGGGVGYDLGTHLIDQAVQLFGPVASFVGELDTRNPGAGNDDDTFIALTHENGVRSHLSMSSLVAQRGFRFRVLGTEGGFTKWGLDPQESQLALGLTPRDAEFGRDAESAYGRLGTDDDFTIIPTENGRFVEFYAGVADAFHGLGPVPVDPADSLVGIEILEALHRG